MIYHRSKKVDIKWYKTLHTKALKVGSSLAEMNIIPDDIITPLIASQNVEPSL